MFAPASIERRIASARRAVPSAEGRWEVAESAKQLYLTDVGANMLQGSRGSIHTTGEA